MKSRSQQTSVSDQCCSRGSCPINMCQCDNQTHYSSVHGDNMSTQYLYFGKQFQCKESDEGYEFKDCRSETEVHKKRSSQLTCLSTSPSVTPSEKNNYKCMLKEVITMSQKVLDRLDKREQKKSSDQSCRTAQSSIPDNCGMSIHVEPVQLAIPFTIHFQSQTIPNASAACPSMNASSAVQRPQICIPTGAYPSNQPCNQRSIQFIAQSSTQCNVPQSNVMQSNAQNNDRKSSTTTKDDVMSSPSKPSTFPFSPESIQEVCVSQGKFPQQDPLTANAFGNMDMICVGSLENEPKTQPPCIPSYEAEGVIECQMNDCMEDTEEKAVQTDKRHGRMKDFKDCAESDSYGYNPNLVFSTEFKPCNKIFEIKVSSRSICGKLPPEPCNTQDPVENLVPCETNSNLRQSITVQNAEADNENVVPIETNGSIRQSITLENPKADDALNSRMSATNPAEELLPPENVEPQFQEQPQDDQPATERLSISQQRVSFSNIARPSTSNAIELPEQDQMQELLKEQELYEKPPPPIDQYESPPITAELPQNMNYPTQFRQSLIECNFCNDIVSDNLITNNSKMSAPVCCECKTLMQKVSETSYITLSCSNQTKSSMTSIAIKCGSSCLACREDEYFSAASDSDNEKKFKCKKEKKLKKKMKKATSSSHSILCAAEKSNLVLVLERILLVLEYMNAQKSRCNTVEPCPQKEQTAPQPSQSYLSLKSLDDSATSNTNCCTCNEDTKSIATPCEPKMPEKKPYLILTLDPKTGIPCYCIRVGKNQSSFHDIPIACANTSDSAPCSDEILSQCDIEEECNISLGNQMVISTEECQECYEEEPEELKIMTMCAETQTEECFDVIPDTQALITCAETQTEECFDVIPDTQALITCAETQTEECCDQIPDTQALITCAETQTEDCFGPFPESGTPNPTELLEQLIVFREELSEARSCSCQDMFDMMIEKTTSVSKSGGDIPFECNCCHCCAERNKGKKPPCTCCECCRRDLKTIVDSVILDLECMEMVRRQNERCPAGIEPLPLVDSRSFPVSITEVTELGKSSLYVKWIIHEGVGIEGYEIYVDGYLTNRYFNSRHEAAVVCDVDVTQAHKISLLARPKEKCNKPILGAGDIFFENEEEPMTSDWKPSTYLYEPSRSLDYTKCF